MKQEIIRLRDQYQFFHWHLAFPDVFTPMLEPTADDVTGWSGGFNIVLGNPPWEMMELSEKEFFAHRAPEVLTAKTAGVRKRLIDGLSDTSPSVHNAFLDAKRQMTGMRHLLQSGGQFPRGTVGRINSYPLFVELSLSICASRGRTGLLVPSAVAMDAYNASLFGFIVTSQRLVALIDFENRDALFLNVHRSYRFALLVCTGTDISSPEMTFAFFCANVGECRPPVEHFRLRSPNCDSSVRTRSLLQCFRASATCRLLLTLQRYVCILNVRSRDCFAA